MPPYHVLFATIEAEGAWVKPANSHKGNSSHTVAQKQSTPPECEGVFKEPEAEYFGGEKECVRMSCPVPFLGRAPDGPSRQALLTEIHLVHFVLNLSIIYCRPAWSSYFRFIYISARSPPRGPSLPCCQVFSMVIYVNIRR